MKNRLAVLSMLVMFSASIAMFVAFVRSLPVSDAAIMQAQVKWKNTVFTSPTPSPSPGVSPTPTPSATPSGTPTATPTATASFPPPVTGNEVYGTGTNVNGNTTLHWNKWMHTDVPRPMAIVVHAAQYRFGNPGPGSVCNDLYFAGFNCVAIEHRLADPGVEMHPPRGDQPVADHGLAPEQTDDVATAVQCARTGCTAGTTGKVNGKVAVVGGSSGGGHASFVGADTTNGIAPPDCIVSLSGAYDFHDTASYGPRCGNDPKTLWENYVGCTDADTGCLGAGGMMDLASPYKRFKSTSKPMALYTTNQDSMPPNQWTIATNLLTSLGAPFVARMITETPDGTGCTRHSWNYWTPNPPDQPDSVKDEAIAFIKTYCPVP